MSEQTSIIRSLSNPLLPPTVIYPGLPRYVRTHAREHACKLVSVKFRTSLSKPRSVASRQRDNRQREKDRERERKREPLQRSLLRIPADAAGCGECGAAGVPGWDLPQCSNPENDVALLRWRAREESRGALFATRDRGALLKAERVLCNELNVAGVPTLGTRATAGVTSRPRPCARRISLDISEVYVQSSLVYVCAENFFSSSSRDWKKWCHLFESRIRVIIFLLMKVKPFYSLLFIIIINY